MISRKKCLGAKRRRVETPAAAFVVAGVPFAAFTTLMLYHFYIKGAFFWDSGLLAALLSEADPRLPTRRALMAFPAACPT